MPKNRRRKQRAAVSQVRIIGGQWRGHKLDFAPEEGLRPTGDRVRETLFNWLAGEIAGARCLDLFAGSGALGLEALSRGASHCDFVDTSAAALAGIQAHLERLRATDRAACHPGRAEDFLARARGSYRVVFIDPPFGLDLVAGSCAALEERALLDRGALIYVETPVGEDRPGVPDSWHLHRDKRAGNVAYRLYLRP